jgi:hypothetical protein
MPGSDASHLGSMRSVMHVAAHIIGCAYLSPASPPLPPHLQILGRFIRYMSEVGQADQVPMSKHGADLARV